jgi:hypothetical protein
MERPPPGGTGVRSPIYYDSVARTFRRGRHAMRALVTTPVGSRPPLAFVALLAVVATFPTVALAEGKGPIVVRVEKFEVPDEVHDHFKNELKLWPTKMAKATPTSGAVKLVAGGEEGRFVLRGKVVASRTEIKIVAELLDGKKSVWHESYKLTEFPKKVEFVDQTREKIVAGVKKHLSK